MDRLRQALKFGGILADGDIDYTISCFEHKWLKSGEHFHNIGQVATQIAFVETGILRIYSIDVDGNDVTKYFIREGQFTVDLESYYTSKASADGFQAVIASEIYTIHQSEINRLVKDIPNLYIFLKSITEAQLLSKIKDTDFLNFGDSKIKYLELSNDILL